MSGRSAAWATAVFATFATCVGVGVGACSGFGDEPETPEEGASPDASQADGTTATDAGSEATTNADADACTTVERTHDTSNADAPIGFGSPTQPRGSDSSICNMVVGACLLRFDLDPNEQTAFAENRVRALTLTLRRADQHVECGGNCATPTFRQAGTLQVLPLSTDWLEGAVTWNTRNGTTAWTTAGALGTGDVGASAGSLVVPAATVTASVELDPTQWKAGLLTGGAIAFRTSFIEGGNPRAFVAVLRETQLGGVVPKTPPTLVVRYCP